MATARKSKVYRRIPREHVLADHSKVIEAQLHHLDSRVPPHDHDFVEMVIVTAGKANHVSHIGEHQLKRGSCMLLRPGTWHTYENCKHLKLYNCYFGPELLERELHWLADDAAMASLIWTGVRSLNVARCCMLKLDESQTRRCEKLVKQIADDSKDRLLGPIGRIGILLRMFELLATAAGNSSDRQLPTKVHPLVRRGQRLLETDLADEWTLGLLADRLKTGRHHLARLFREHTGLPPMAYLAHLRTQHAAALLLSTDDPVGEVGRRVGWPDANYFARRFKQHFGCTASAYRSRYSSHQHAVTNETSDQKLP